MKEPVNSFYFSLTSFEHLFMLLKSKITFWKWSRGPLKQSNINQIQRRCLSNSTLVKQRLSTTVTESIFWSPHPFWKKIKGQKLYSIIYSKEWNNSICNNMDCHTKWSQTERDKYDWCHLYVESRRMILMNLLTEQKRSHRLRK